MTVRGIRLVGFVGLAIILGLVTLLAGSRPSHVSFSGQFETNHVSVRLTEPALIEGLAASEISVTFSGSIYIDGQASDVGYGGLSLIARQPALELGSSDLVNIESLSIEAGATLSLTTDPRSGLTTLRLFGDPIEFPVFASRDQTVIVDPVFCSDVECSDIIPDDRPFYVRTDGQAETIITFPSPKLPVFLTSLLSVESLDFWRLIATPNAQSKDSGLITGSFVFLETGDLENSVWPRSVLSIRGEDILVRSLELRDHRFHVSASGRIHRFDTEIGERRRSLKPNLFETWSRNPSLQVIAGLLSIVLGGGIVLMEILRRLNLQTLEATHKKE